MKLLKALVASLLVLIIPAPAHAVGEPTVTWVSPLDGSTVNGVVTLEASASPTAPDLIEKWCITVDGSPLSFDAATMGSVLGVSNDLAGSAYFSSGCFFTSIPGASGYSLIDGFLTFDTTTWANGTHTFTAIVTDSSGRVSTTATTTIVTSTGNPTVTWKSPADGSTQNGVVTLQAQAQPDAGGTALIQKWCITVDGSPLSFDAATMGSVLGVSNDLAGSAYFSSGCFFTSIPGASGYSLIDGFLTFDTTTWANGTHTFTAIVTDSSGRVSTTATTTIVTSTGNPTVTWKSPADGSTQNGVVTLQAQAQPDAGGTALIQKWCITVDGSPLSFDAATMGSVLGVSNDLAGSAYFSSGCFFTSIPGASGYSLIDGFLTFDTTTWANGTHTFTAIVTDSSGRVSTTATTTIVTSTGNPTVTWKSPADGSTQNGVVTLQAQAQPDAGGTALIQKWCITVDGSPLSFDAATMGSVLGVSNDLAGSAYFSSGCFFTSIPGASGYSLIDGFLTFDTTTWANGTHTFTAIVTDSSGRVSTTATTTIVVNIPSPTVTWISPTQSSRQGGVVMLQARASTLPGGAASIARWCFTIDGILERNDLALLSSGNGVSNDLESSATFDGNGCYNLEWGASLEDGIFNFRTGTMSNGLHNFGLTVYDAYGRASAESVLQLDIQNDAPSLVEVWTQTKSNGLEAKLQFSLTANTSLPVLFEWLLDGKALDEQPVSCSFEEDDCIGDYTTTGFMSRSQVSAGRHTITVYVTLENGEVLSKSITTTVTWPISVTWASATKKSQYKMGKSAVIAGFISSDGQGPKTVQIRTKASGRSWTSWRTVPVKSNYFSLRVVLTRNTSVEVKVPSTKLNKGTTVSRVLTVVPSVRISGATRIYADRKATFSVQVGGGWSGTCTVWYYPKLYNALGYYVPASAERLDINIRGGRGSFWISSAPYLYGTFRVVAQCGGGSVGYGQSELSGTVRL